MSNMNFSDKQIQIIIAAEKLFSIKGYDGTSVRDIAEDAGINIAMISYYFGSKEKLMQAIFEIRMGNLTEKIEDLLHNDDLSPIEKLEVLIDDYIDRVDQRQQFYRLLICEQMMDKNPIITGLLNELKKKNAILVEILIKDGQKKKAFKKDVDTVLLMNTLIGVVMQSFVNKEYYKNYNNLEAMPATEFEALLKNKLSLHIKDLFKAILSL